MVNDKMLAEFERMLDTNDNLLDRKAELIELTNVLNRRINAIDDLITVYSSLDYIRVGELAGERIKLNNELLSVLDESNELYLESIRLSKNKVAWF